MQIFGPYYFTPDQSKNVQPVTRQDRPITAVIHFLFKFGGWGGGVGRIPDLGLSMGETTDNSLFQADDFEMW